MSLEALSKQLASGTEQSKKMPPVELWDPPYCGEIDLVIKADGNWFYNGTVFKRLSLVKLFASVLICQKNDRQQLEYFLVTPVEKIKIQVEDAPFILTQWQYNEDKSAILVSTNLADEFVLDKDHPITVNDKGELYVEVRRGLNAKVHRNVYYQWIDIAQEQSSNKGVELVIRSAGEDFVLGHYQ